MLEPSTDNTIPLCDSNDFSGCFTFRINYDTFSILWYSPIFVYNLNFRPITSDHIPSTSHSGASSPSIYRPHVTRIAFATTFSFSLRNRNPIQCIERALRGDQQSRPLASAT